MASSLDGTQLVAGADLDTIISTPAVATSPVEFTLFPKLPLELRRKVWREAITPRVIYILKDDSADRLRWKAITSGTIALLAVNTESRSEGLMIYETPFTTGGISGQEASCRGPCYVNFAHDLIYINFIHLQHCFNIIFVDEMQHQDRFLNIALDMESIKHVTDQLRYIVFDNDIGNPYRSNAWTWDNFVLRNIKELVMVEDHTQGRANAKKIILSERTHQLTFVKAATETAFAAFKHSFPDALLPELSTCHRLLSLH